MQRLRRFALAETLRHPDILPSLPAGRWVRHAAPWLTVMIILGVWHWLSSAALVPPSLLPSPFAVWEALVTSVTNGRLWLHTSVTLGEVLAGLGLGVTVGLGVGYCIARVPLLEALLSPLIITLQSTPVVAYAPLLVIWFGSGATSKILICALITSFPLLMNTVVGIRGVPQRLRDLMRVSQANGWQTLMLLEVPAALPVLLTGLKTSATLAVIGAVVGEFINASAGLGFLITLARSQYDTPLVFVAVITLAVMARVLYGMVALLERWLLAWKQ
ncbi:MAG: ABC transporter permease, partial [Armatimonadetes bacterium]|nr:ABC transporter permease [Anaerolineae bacterium]